jgi:hypothetical protein
MALEGVCDIEVADMILPERNALMSDSLHKLEVRRSDQPAAIFGLHDMRPGSIVARYVVAANRLSFAHAK